MTGLANLWRRLRARLLGQRYMPSARQDADIPNAIRLRFVAVYPSRKFVSVRRLTDGGPVWPKTTLCSSLRHHVSGQPVDREKKCVEVRKLHRFDRPAIWGGYARDHFGHFVAEHLPRLPMLASQRPNDTILMVLAPGAKQPPPFFAPVMKWYGIEPSRVKFVRKPLLVQTLRAMPQAEHLPNFGPGPEFVDFLDRNVIDQGLVPIPSSVVFVGRPGLLENGKGGFAGESYLIESLARQGVTVLNPAQSPLREQLAHYLGAKTIVFAEGSAMHGRQLLGRLVQDIVVLRRRLGSNLAKDMLAPRCTKLRYVDTFSSMAKVNTKEGQANPTNALVFYDLDALFSAFVGLGIDLAQTWDHAAYMASVRKDAQIWVEFHRGKGRLLTDRNISDSFSKMGILDVLSRQEPQPRAATPCLTEGNL